MFSLKFCIEYVGFSFYQHMLLGNVLPWLPTILSHSKEMLEQALERRSDGLSIDTKQNMTDNYQFLYKIT